MIDRSISILNMVFKLVKYASMIKRKPMMIEKGMFLVAVSFSKFEKETRKRLVLNNIKAIIYALKNIRYKPNTNVTMR